MDRKYIEENLSAYLDGELQPKEMREFERDIQSYPDLFAELQTLQRLNKLALDSEAPLPNDVYFDSLADRIDAQIKRESPRERSKVIEFLLERRRSVAIISSAAAVLLIALIGMNMFGPNAKRYPNELRTIEVKPAILQSPKTDTATIWPQHEQKIVPPPTIESDDTNRVVPEGRNLKESKKERTTKDVQLLERDVPATQHEAAGTPLSNSSTSPKNAVGIVEQSTIAPNIDTLRPFRTDSIDRPPDLTLSSLEFRKPTMSDQAASSAPSIRFVTIRTETILPGPFEEKSFADAAPGQGAIKPDIERFHAGSEKSWDTYVKVFNELNQNMYSSWSLTAPATSRDSLQSWVDSLKIIGPSLWYAEQAFRALQVSPPNWDEYQRCRAYIDYYLAEYQIPDSSVWNHRIDIVNEVLERQLGKTYQPHR